MIAEAPALVPAPRPQYDLNSSHSMSSSDRIRLANAGTAPQMLERLRIGLPAQRGQKPRAAHWFVEVRRDATADSVELSGNRATVGHDHHAHLRIRSDDVSNRVVDTTR